MITDINPFIYSRPVSPEDIMDRDEETNKLLKNALGGHYVRLFAPRKYGKTSLLGRVLRDAHAREQMTPVLVDLYRVTSIADVTIRFERAYSVQLKGPVRAKIEQFLQRTGIGLSLGAYGISAKLQLDPKTDPLPALHSLLDLPLHIEQSGGYRALIAFDEFQDIDQIPDLDGLIRSHIQYQGEVASYIFAGSEPGLMKQLFENKQRPLYGSAVPMRLERLVSGDIAEYVGGRFDGTGRSVGEALNPLVDAAKGHPQRAMLLAHRLWEEVPHGTTATLDHWIRAHAAAQSELSAEFDAQWRGYDVSEQRTMRAIVAGDGSPYKASVLERLGVTKDMVRKALPRLMATADIETVAGKPAVVDPLFEAWIARLNRGESDLDGQ